MATMGAPSNVVYLTTMEASRETLQPLILSSKLKLSPEGVELIQAGLSSFLANFVSLIPYVPAEVVSSRVIVSPTKVSMFGMCRIIYQEKGLRGFYKGFNASLALWVTSSSQWWWMYGVSRRIGMQTELGKSHPLAVEASCGCLAGMSAVAVSYPIDTIKTRIMASQAETIPSFRQVFTSLVRRDGFRALYRGLPASLSQAALGSTIFATCYESIKSTAQTF